MRTIDFLKMTAICAFGALVTTSCNDDDDDDDDVNRVDWWLRSPGYSQNEATIVDCGGASFVDDVFDTQTSVRPAMWVNLEALIFQA